jgi:hypothetical protein
VYPNVVYPNPLVADLIASGIANRIALLAEHGAESNDSVQDALARLEHELDEFAAALKASIDLLKGRSFGLA